MASVKLTLTVDTSRLNKRVKQEADKLTADCPVLLDFEGLYADLRALVDFNVHFERIAAEAVVKLDEGYGAERQLE